LIRRFSDARRFKYSLNVVLIRERQKTETCFHAPLKKKKEALSDRVEDEGNARGVDPVVYGKKTQQGRKRPVTSKKRENPPPFGGLAGGV